MSSIKSMEMIKEKHRPNIPFLFVSEIISNTFEKQNILNNFVC